MRHRDIFSDDPARRFLPWGALAPVLGLVFVVLSQAAGTLPVARLFARNAAGDPVDFGGLVAFLCLPFGLLLAIVLAWVRWIEARPLAAIGLRGPRMVRTFCRGHLLGLAAVLGIVGIIRLAGGLSPAPHAPSASGVRAVLDAALLLPSFALQASAEEVLFRGWLLSVLAKKFDLATGVLVSSALFCLLHWTPDTPWLLVLTSLLFALFCCGWAVRSRGVLGVMGWHAAWNWLLAVGFGLPVTGLDAGVPPLLVGLRPSGPAWLSGGAQGPEGSVICAGLLLAGVAWFLVPARRGRPRPAAFALGSGPARQGQVVSPRAIATSLTEHWSPRVIGEVDDAYVKVAKVRGECVWHSHDDEDELFLVLSGRLRIEIEDRAVQLGEGDLFVVPKRARHRPVAAQECLLMLIERKSTLHTGSLTTAMTRSLDEQLRPV